MACQYRDRKGAADPNRAREEVVEPNRDSNGAVSTPDGPRRLPVLGVSKRRLKR